MLKSENVKAIVTFIVVAGTIAIFPLMAYVKVVPENKDLVNFLLGAWVGTGFTMVMKRLFDSTESSDVKNATIASMAAKLGKSDGASS